MWEYLKSYLPPGPYSARMVGFALLPVLIALVMLTVERFGLQGVFINDFGPSLVARGLDANEIRFLAQVWYTGFSLLFFVAVPLLYHTVFPPGLDNPFGLALRGCRPHVPVYVLILAIMIPLLWISSAQPVFHHFYPMYKPPSMNMWLLFEAVYMLQFFCVEFFFRGFALFRLEQRFGYMAISIMVVPYALLHVHKPFPEGVASIVAGLVLGMLALKSRSIWPGVLIHCTVAFCMDLFALLRSGRMALLW